MNMRRQHVYILLPLLFLAGSSVYSHYVFTDDHRTFHQRVFRVSEILSPLDLRIDDRDHTIVHLAGLETASQEYLSDHVLNQNIRLYLPPLRTRDNKNRLLAYIYLSDTKCVQRDMISSGLANPTGEPHLLASPFHSDLLKARRKHLGIWKKNY